MENQAIYYYLSPEGANVGPLTLTQLKNLHQDGTITDSTYVISTIEKKMDHICGTACSHSGGCLRFRSKTRASSCCPCSGRPCAASSERLYAQT